MLSLSFAGKTAIVTGATRGIGRAIADLLRASGSRVIYTGTRVEQTIDPQGREFFPLDFLDERSMTDFFQNIQQFPSIDILVNNAGINIIEPVQQMRQDHWDEIIQVNLTGTMRMTKEVSGIMIRNKTPGRILNVSSIFGVISKANRGSYSASKSGMIGLTMANALDLAPYGILVNAICPGFTTTEMTESILSLRERETLAQQVPLGRFASVDEMAKAAVFLCSEHNSFMTGQTLIIDGGFTIQ
jgi:3-oxoacyl-[acyl-carrier protein] reductase